MRKIVFYGFAGIIIGISANQAFNLVLSYALHLGYYAPCLVALPEIAGGELNAAFLQTAVMAAAGGIAGLLTWGWKKHKPTFGGKGKHTLSARKNGCRVI